MNSDDSTRPRGGLAIEPVAGGGPLIAVCPCTRMERVVIQAGLFSPVNLGAIRLGAPLHRLPSP